MRNSTVGFYEMVLLDDLNTMARVQVLMREGSEARELVTKRIGVLINELRDQGVVLDEKTELRDFAWSLVFVPVDVQEHLFIVNRLHEIVLRDYMPASVQEAALSEIVKEKEYLLQLGIEIELSTKGLTSWRDVRRMGGWPNPYERISDYEHDRQPCAFCGQCGHRTSDDDLPSVGQMAAATLNGNPSF